MTRSAYAETPSSPRATRRQGSGPVASTHPGDPRLASLRIAGLRIACLTVALAGVLALLAAVAVEARAADEEPQVIELTQVACQFLESENGVDHDFQTQKKADCVAINERTGAERLAEAKTLKLEPGTYIFRVTNVDVPYDLGFWLREKGYDWRNPVHKLTKTSVSGGGLAPGTTKDYEVTLAPGDYVYSCPLNPTPDYRLTVPGQQG